MALDTLTTGLAVAVGSDIVIRIITYLRKGILVSTPMKKQLEEILAVSKATNDEQKEQRKDMAKLFELMEAVLVAGQLTAKSCTDHQFNGDLEEATKVIDKAIEERKKYVDKKAFPE